MARFGVTMRGITEGISARTKRVIRRSHVELFNRIVDRTPVDTGNARGGWRQGGTLEAYTIFNAVHYIRKLEHGASQQAPLGMVGISVAEFPKILKDMEERER